MVRGRRVRAAVVACGPDDSCSPNAKRKDKFIMPKCAPKTNQSITKYFHTAPPIQDSQQNDLPDTTPLETIKSPATPHRIQLPNDTTKPPPLHEPPPQPKARKKLLQPPQTTITSYFPSVRRSVRKTKSTVLEERQRCIEDLIRSGVEDGLTVRQFAGKGRGVVTVRQFDRGDFVVEYSGELIDMAEARCREGKYAMDDRGCYMYYFSWKSKQYCIDATAESGRFGRLVNHSRGAANLCTRIVPLDGVPRLCLVARDTVPVGDEITYDYGDRSKESLQHHPWLAY